jgi:hypothetical protein
MSDTKTNQELALALLHKLVDLETERLAMEAVLNSCRDIDTRQLLNWRPAVEKCRYQIAQDNPVTKYSDIEHALSVATPESPEALSLLLEVAELIQKP